MGLVCRGAGWGAEWAVTVALFPAGKTWNATLGDSAREVLRAAERLSPRLVAESIVEASP